MEESAQSPHVFPSSRFPTTPATKARAHLNGLTIRLRPQIQKLEPLYKIPSFNFRVKRLMSLKNFLRPFDNVQHPAKKCWKTLDQPGVNP